MSGSAGSERDAPSSPPRNTPSAQEAHTQARSEEMAPDALTATRRGLLRLGAGGLAAGAAWLAGCRTPFAHKLPTHEVAPRIQGPGYPLIVNPEQRVPSETMKVYEPTPPRDAPSDPGAYKRFDIQVDIITHEYLPGVSAHVLGFNHQVPGPEIRVNEGDWVQVRFKNNTKLLHTIHWHGLFVPSNMDGVPYVTQPPTMPDQTFVYRFRALPYGTHFYHCHFGTPLHMQSAMHGAFLIDKDPDPVKKEFPYTREYTLILNQVDTAMMRRELTEMVTRMRERVVLMARNRITDRILARFENKAAFLKAIRDGWVPPYKQSRTLRPQKPQYNIYTMNGKAYPMTPVLEIKRDEIIRIRLINVGSVEHYLHLHGHDFWEVCRDGAVLPHAVRGNTLPVTPGRTHDLILEGTNPGVWTFHDHAVTRATNNGRYPGGILTLLRYEDFTPEYSPKVALDE